MGRQSRQDSRFLWQGVGYYFNYTQVFATLGINLSPSKLPNFIKLSDRTVAMISRIFFFCSTAALTSTGWVQMTI